MIAYNFVVIFSSDFFDVLRRSSQRGEKFVKKPFLISAKINVGGSTNQRIGLNKSVVGKEFLTQSSLDTLCTNPLRLV